MSEQDHSFSHEPAPEDLISDWYLPVSNPLDGFVYPSGRTISRLEPLHAPAQHLFALAMLHSKEGAVVEFSFESEGRVFRGHVIHAIKGKIFQLRRLPTSIPPLNELGLPVAIQEILIHDRLRRGGLVLIAGETGQGKSTTCAAAIKARIEKFGAFCLTIEDPPEAPLDGKHKRGRCIQTPVESGKFAEAMRGALRAYPTTPGNILYVGETRDSETASEVLKIAINGHLVFSTVHADSVIGGIKRFVSLAASQKDMSETAVNSLCADAFRLLIHQRLEDQVIQGRTQKKLAIEFLMSKDGTTAASHMIRKGTIEGLSNPIDLQRSTLMVQGVEALMKEWG